MAILIAAVVGALISGFSIGPALSERPFHLIANVLFLDTVHIVFTFVMIESFPELREWITTSYFKTIGHFRWFSIGALFFLTCFFAAALIAFHSLLRDRLWLVELFFIWTTVVHRLYQTKGMSALYSHRLLSTDLKAEIDKVQFRSIEKFESILFKLLIFVILLTSVTRSIGDDAAYVIHTSLNSWHYLELAVAHGLVVLIFCNAARSPVWFQTAKPFFLMRLLLAPLSFFSLSALLALGAIHGLEHLMILTMMRSRSALSPAGGVRFSRALGLSALGLGFVSTLYILSPPGVIGLLAASFITGLAHLHFLTERFLFRMRRPLTRQMVGPLLGARVRFSTD